jgi:rubrerythrin
MEGADHTAHREIGHASMRTLEPPLALSIGTFVDERPVTTKPADLPSIAERLLYVLESHVSAEKASLHAYDDLAEQTGDRVAAVLMRLIVEDEKRHHQILARMIRTVQDAVDWTHSPDALPVDPPRHVAQAEAAIQATRALIHEEHEGAKELRRMAHEDPHLLNGLYAVLLDTMARDSEKHEEILRFVLKRLEAAA